MLIQKRLVILILVLLSLFSYANSLRGGFVWDDVILINQNPYIQSLKHLGVFFVKDIWKVSLLEVPSGYYRPLLASSFALDYAVWKKNPWGYHLTNLLWHIGAVILVFWLAYALLNDIKFAFLSGALFCVHPIHTEAVAFISGRVDSLCLFFYLAALLMFMRRIRTGRLFWHICSLGFFFAALLVKEMAISFPLIALATDYFFISRQDRGKFISGLKERHLGYLAVILIYLALRLIFVGQEFWLVKKSSASNFIYGTSPLWRLYTVVMIVGYYIGLLIVPYRLNADHLFPPANYFFEPDVIIGALVIIVLILSALRLRKPYPVVSYAILWFFLAIGPVSNIIPQGNIFAERFMYTPSVGICLGAGYAMVYFSRRGPLGATRTSRSLYWVMIALILVLFMRTTFERNGVWKDDGTLWLETARASPLSPRAHHNLANVYQSVGLYDQAIAEYNIEVRLAQDIRRAYLALNNVGNLYLSKGLIDEAIKAYQLAISMYPKRAAAYSNLSSAYGKQKKYAESVQAAQTALKLNPYMAEAHYNLAFSYLNLGDNAEAIKSFEAFRALYPDYPGVYYELGRLYYQKQDKVKAKMHFQEALRLRPEFRPAQEALRRLDGESQ